MVERSIAQQILDQEKSLPDGFHGLLIRPDGREGFLSKINTPGGESISWFIVGQGQDPTEVMKVGVMLHKIYSTPNVKVDSNLISYLGKRAEELAKPK